MCTITKINLLNFNKPTENYIKRGTNCSKQSFIVCFELNKIFTRSNLAPFSVNYMQTNGDRSCHGCSRF